MNTTTSSDARTWGMLCHLSALAMLIFSWGAIVGPLVVWLIKRNESSFIDENGKESLNFQITIFLISVILGIAIGLLFAGGVAMGAIWGNPFSFAGGMAGGFGVLGLLGIVRLVDFILVIVASVQANKGISYRYPFNIRFIK